MIRDPLDIGIHSQDKCDEPKVGGKWILQCKNPIAFLLDSDFFFIDLFLDFGNHLRGRFIELPQRIDGGLDDVDRLCGFTDHPTAHLRKIIVERDVG